MDAPVKRKSASSASRRETSAPRHEVGPTDVPPPGRPDEDIQKAAIQSAGWFATALMALCAGLWGVTAGWYFGLPLGGWVPQELFYDRAWHWQQSFSPIPDPDFASLPVFPVPVYQGRYIQRNGFEPLAWLQSGGPAGGAQFLTPVLPDEPPGLNQFRRAYAQAPSTPQAQKPAPQAEPFATYRSNLASSSLVLAAIDPNICLSISAAEQTPAQGPSQTAVQAPATPRCQIVSFDLGKGLALRVAPQSIEIRGPRGVNAMPMTARSLSLGMDARGVLTAIWVGGLGGEVTKISPDHGEIPEPAQLPTTKSIDLLFFVSPSRGFALASNAADFEPGLDGYQAVMQTSDGGQSWQRLRYRWLPAPWVFVAFIVALVAFDQGTRARSRLRPVSETANIADHGVSDDPIGLADADALGLRPIASAMTRFLRNVQTVPTVTIAVTGPWGSGKTSLMNLVREELRESNVYPVWFNAWHNQKEDNLLAALLASIRSQAIPPPWTLPGLQYRLRVAFWRITEDPGRSLAFVVFIAIAAWLFIAHADQSVKLLQKFAGLVGSLFGSGDGKSASVARADQAAGAIATLGFSTGGLAGLLFAGKRLWDLFTPLKSIPADLLAHFSGTTKVKDLDQQLSFRYRFAQEFATFCETLRRAPDPGLVIFVDDLDRCAPTQTVDVLEAINFVASAGRCFIVLGLDESKVKAAIADVYKDVTLKLDLVGVPAAEDEQSPAEMEHARTRALIQFASNYLEKLIHLAVPVPRSRRENVEMLLGLEEAPKPSQRDRLLGKARRMALDFAGTVMVVLFLSFTAWLIVVAATRSLPAAATESAAATSAPLVISAGAVNAVAGGTQVTVTPPAGETGPVTLSDAQLGQLGIMSNDPFGSIPPVVLVWTFVLLLTVLALQLIPRLYPEPIVNDSPVFQDALRIWLEGISLRRDTPRAVKRFVNRLRFMAMRVRDINDKVGAVAGAASLDEPTLVTFATIESIDEQSLGRSAQELTMQIAGKSPADQGAGLRIIANGLQRFGMKFRDPYSDEDALATYKAIAGLVEERGGRDNPDTSGPPPT